MRVFLARHGEAAPGERVPDHGRPLTLVGRRQARELGSWLSAREQPPTVLRCSSATRTIETATGLLEMLPIGSPLVGEEALYLATAEDLLSIVRAEAREGATPILVGHNPGMAQLALGLARYGEPGTLRRLHARFPPGGCAELELPEHPAGGIATARGELVAFFTPA